MPSPAFLPPSPTRLPSHAQSNLSHHPRRSTPSLSLAPPVTFPRLRASVFQHPLDRASTRALARLPFLEPALRTALAAAESSLVLDSLASGVRVTEVQLPSLHAAVKRAAEVLAMPVPDLYVRQSAAPNAYTLAVQGRRPFIVVTSGLLELLTADEVAAVIGHECGHLKAEHGVYLGMANVLLLAGGSILGGAGRVVSEVGQRALWRWQRSAELTCDRAALLVVQDRRIVSRALMKLAGGAKLYGGEMDVDEYVKQADDFDAEAKRGVGRLVRVGMSQGQTHPFPVHRVKELNVWASSNVYRQIVRSGKKSGKV